MQSEEDISTQLPPPIEELDQAMGATQLSNDEKNAPPSPSLVPEKEEKEKKKMHLPPLAQMPYPMDMGSLEMLENAPVPDWKALLPKQQCTMRCSSCS